jgi:hypothetical protein
MELNEFASFETLKEGSLQQRNKLMELELASSSIPPFFSFFFFFLAVEDHNVEKLCVCDDSLCIGWFCSWIHHSKINGEDLYVMLQQVQAKWMPQRYIPLIISSKDMLIDLN